MTNDENSVPTNIASGTQVYGGRDGIVSGSDGSDLIDQDYTGDPDGDRIDAGDAILAGAAPNDDLVQAGDGDDTVFAGLVTTRSMVAKAMTNCSARSVTT